MRRDGEALRAGDSQLLVAMEAAMRLKGSMKEGWQFYLSTWRSSKKMHDRELVGDLLKPSEDEDSPHE
ncbi:hypothetical protein PIB30_070883 [Stylosanthes scabra]|uniref:Uncharacterized protein n=1 Tax=Stylosanthes scabra TaxID=79078 RepID=A0ABU6TPA6_9FABA|nr:hypothetical protein [Stylosanthes scabra]